MMPLHETRNEAATLRDSVANFENETHTSQGRMFRNKISSEDFVRRAPDTNRAQSLLDRHCDTTYALVECKDPKPAWLSKLQTPPRTWICFIHPSALH
eukprot:2799541-Amphidinium_carterae.1